MAQSEDGAEHDLGRSPTIPLILSTDDDDSVPQQERRDSTASAMSPEDMMTKRRPSFFEPEDEDDDDMDEPGLTKVLTLLRSLRPEFEKKADYLQINGARLGDSVSVDSSPLERLDWCLSTLHEMHAQSKGSVKELIKHKLMKNLQKGGEGADIARWVETMYFEEGVPHKRASKTTIGSSPERLLDQTVTRVVRSRSVEEIDISAMARACAHCGSTGDAHEHFSSPVHEPRFMRFSHDIASELPIAARRNFSLPVMSAAFPLTMFSSECMRFIETNLGQWEFDVFALEDISSNYPMTAVSLSIFRRLELYKLPIEHANIQRFLMAVEDEYERYPRILYHNNLHAADVTHTTYCLLQSPSLAGVFSTTEFFAGIIAAAAHDVNHPGVTNQFLVATRDPLALLYNDQSVLENHHAATLFKIMQSEDCNLLSGFEPEDRTEIRRMVIKIILSTDMAKHFEFLAEFRALLDKRSDHSSPSGAIDLSDASTAERLTLLCAIVHCADLGGPTKPWEMCKTWCRRIISEFFNQGDREAELKMEVGPMNDRNKISIPGSQIGFIDFVVLPLWETWDSLVCGSVQMNYLTENRQRWAEEEELERATGLKQILPIVLERESSASQHARLPAGDGSAAASPASRGSSPRTRRARLSEVPGVSHLSEA